MDATTLAIFLAVYAGMMLGEWPGLALDRTGIALLGAIMVLASGSLSMEQAWQSVDTSTLGLLFGLMVVSAQFRIGGFYSRFTRWLANLDVSPQALLAGTVIGAGVLSALLANDIVCLAMAPLLAEACAQRGWRPIPFLLALACASNIGSAATLIGNPQNMLIGQTLQLSFSKYLAQALAPSVAGLAAVWVVIVLKYTGRWLEPVPIKPVEAVPFLRWQTAKGLVVLSLLMAAFLCTEWPRDVVALAGAGVLLLSRKVASHRYIQLVDWNLLILFIGLFIVNGAFQHAGWLSQVLTMVTQIGIDPTHPGWLFGLSVVLSNLVSNVPATMLLLPVAKHPLSGPILALSSTLSGNLIIVGSIANIIVVDQAKRVGVRISWWEHALVGVPVTIASLVLAAVWLFFWHHFVEYGGS